LVQYLHCELDKWGGVFRGPHYFVRLHKFLSGNA
jgi:hypothetical protein